MIVPASPAWHDCRQLFQRHRCNRRLTGDGRVWCQCPFTGVTAGTTPAALLFVAPSAGFRHLVRDWKDWKTVKTAWKGDVYSLKPTSSCLLSRTYVRKRCHEAAKVKFSSKFTVHRQWHASTPYRCIIVLVYIAFPFCTKGCWSLWKLECCGDHC